MSVELANGQQRAMVRHSNHDRLVVSVAFRPDGRLLATASSESDRTAKEWALVWRWFHERWTCDLPGDLIATGISGPCACGLGGGVRSLV
jgi:WD40 repeat protein